MNNQLSIEDFQRWGAEGGRVSRRSLSCNQARMMALQSAAAKRRRAREKNTVMMDAGRPVSGTEEWATENVNIQSGCEHDCLYCYAKSGQIRYKRQTPESWKNAMIRLKDVEKRRRKRAGNLMFPTSHDITPQNIEACLIVLRKLLDAGNDVLIVSKPTPSVVRRLCAELTDYRKQVLFRFTIGSVHDSALSYWEPNAPLFKERLESLRLAFHSGYSTSVSVEPMLDNNVDELVQILLPFITDDIWLGRVNRLPAIIAGNCPGNEEAARRAHDLLRLHDDEWVRSLFNRYRNKPKVKWKDSIKKVVGLKRPTRKGLNI